MRAKGIDKRVLGKTGKNIKINQIKEYNEENLEVNKNKKVINFFKISEKFQFDRGDLAESSGKVSENLLTYAEENNNKKSGKSIGDSQAKYCANMEKSTDSLQFKRKIFFEKTEKKKKFYSF